MYYEKHKKLISKLIAVLMIISLCTASILTTSAVSLPEGAVVCNKDHTCAHEQTIGLVGDSDLNDKINVRDVTKIQKHIAKILELDETAAVLSDVDLNNAIYIKDASAKYIAKHKVEHSIEKDIYIPSESDAQTTDAPAENSYTAYCDMCYDSVSSPYYYSGYELCYSCYSNMKYTTYCDKCGKSVTNSYSSGSYDLCYNCYADMSTPSYEKCSI